MMFKLAKLFSIAMIIAALFFFLASSITLSDPEPSRFQTPIDERIKLIALIVSILTFIVSAAGTAFTVLFGWRRERREAVESKLKIAQLEILVTQLRAGQSPGRP